MAIRKNTDNIIEEYAGIQSGVATLIGRGPQSGNSSTIRAGFNRADYEYYRSAESIPKQIRSSIMLCDQAYNNVFIVRSVIDMMADFTVQGIRIKHRNKRIQQFLNEWCKFVNFHSISERIANTLYRSANCPVKITYGKVPLKTENKWKSATANVIKNIPIDKRTIPLKYNILNPATIVSIGGAISTFLGDPIYGLELNQSIVTDIKRIKENKELLTDKLDINIDITQKTIDGNLIYPLEPSKFRMLFYKKDDWNEFAWPFVHSILEQLILLEKMHLADSRSLDGAISQIRLWRLGDLEKNLPPTKAGINKIRNILANVGTGDVMDIVWGPELDFKESDSKAHQFLKSEKYTQVMTEIYQGLGVPANLTGNAGQSQGHTNNAISMKTLIERLEYGRRILIQFWEEQLEILRAALGWRFSPIIEFDYKVLGDDTLEKNILIDLWDRNILSTETIMELCKKDPGLEQIRIKKENRKRENGYLPHKASPYHNANRDHELKKIILQSGGIAPSELGITLEPRANDKPLGEFKLKEKNNLKIGKIDEGGRPIGALDVTKRKPKNVRPKTSLNFMSLFNWANEAQDFINNTIVPGILNYYSKANIRSLSKKEMEEFETLKFSILCNIRPFDHIAPEIIQRALGDIKPEIQNIVDELKTLYINKNGSEPTIKMIRQMQSTAFALYYET